MKQAIAPMYECRNDIDIFADLARRVGIQAYNDKTEIEWLRELTRDAIDDFDTFMDKGLARLPAPEDAVAAREIREPDRYKFTTPSGKIEVYSMALAANPDPYGLGAIPPIPTWIPPVEADPRHPLQLCSPKSRARTHSIHGNQEVLARADRDDVWLHTADAAARGIADGQRVRVFNDRGATVLPGQGHGPDRAGRRVHPGGGVVHARRAGRRREGLRQCPDRRPLGAERRHHLQHLPGPGGAGAGARLAAHRDIVQSFGALRRSVPAEPPVI
jgi:anaerobic selenocysteine-containing dehydrogenase